MSRLIVKNLPAYLTQDSLRSHFQSKDGPGGTLTDVKVLQKRDGTSRRFGFVGYKTEAEAQKAQKWFDKTFIHSSRISVAIVDGANDAPAPRPNKKPRLGPAPADDVLVVEKAKEPKGKGSEAAQDPQLEEFLDVMKSRAKKGPSWKDGAVEEPQVATKKAKNKPATSTETEHVSEGDEVRPEVASDLDWLKQHTKSALDTEAIAFDQPDEEMQDVRTSQVSSSSHLSCEVKLIIRGCNSLQL